MRPFGLWRTKKSKLFYGFMFGDFMSLPLLGFFLFLTILKQCNDLRDFGANIKKKKSNLFTLIN